ncbi:TetR family transcriptional regulator [Ornithinimicrobium panacihumi]|uniref:TetR family transcriptional regulator n=1 Tax=Ornithinimicrobium panacihumi TaxID=2008449 RepID=UPI003F8C42B9
MTSGNSAAHRGSNRGPAAAQGNRAALVASARRLFAEQGYAVPLTVIAKAAGVGQGSLYRHFPTREDLAAAVVAETMAGLAATVEQHPGPEAFGLVWRAVVEDLVESVGFLDAALGPRGEIGGRAPGSELETLLANPLERAREEGLVDADLTLADVMLVLGMLHGAVHRDADPRTRRETAYRALGLIGRGLALDPRP